jgi:HTH-type transcriptional regulator/antitoxin HigA
VARFDRDKFVRGLSDLHQFVASEHDIRQVPKLLAQLGVRLVIIEHLKGTRIDGAALWLDERSPVIALSLRYDRIDSFWFTLAHECMHVVHRDCSLDSDLVGEKREPTAEKDEIEKRADLEAAAFLVPTDEMEGFLLRMQERFSKSDINRFANRIQVHPGIIAGQLHHRFGTYSHHREMLVPVRQIAIESALSDGWGVCPPI